jgi:hypothetical protein
LRDERQLLLMLGLRRKEERRELGAFLRSWEAQAA